MNAGAIQDWLDDGLEQYQPGNMNLEELQFDKKHRGESKVLLKEPQLKRIDGEGLAGEEESHALLMRLMVEPNSLLARRYPLQHHDLATNIFGSPAGYQRLLQMERSGKADTRERAANCRAGIDALLDMLDERGVELSVPRVPTPKWSDFQHTESAHTELWRRYDDHFRSAYNYLKDERKAKAKAVKATASDTGYTEQNVRRVVNQQRAS